MRPGIARRLRRRLTYANVASTLALVIALSGTTAIAAIVVSSNSQVAQNTISGHKPPSGDHPNIIGGSVNATDLSAAYKATVPVHCPSGMTLASGTSLCFEASPRPAAFWFSALATCYAANLRLPSLGELAQLFNDGGAPQPEEWSGDSYFGSASVEAVALSMATDRTVTPLYEVAGGKMLPYRCVTSATNA